MLTMALIVYIPAFYATEVGLGLTEIGIFFLLARIWDALIDPLVGSLSDATKSRWGARKPYIFVGTPLLMWATWQLFNPAEEMSTSYMLVLLFIYYFSWTIVQIPYLSWGAELSNDYHERSRIVGVREGAMFVGVLMATGLPMLIFPNGQANLPQMLGLFAWITVIILPLSVLVAVTFVPTGVATERAFKAPYAIMGSVLRNKPFRLLLAATFLGWLGVHIYNATVLLIIEYGLRLPTTNFLQLVFIQFLVGTLITPLITRCANIWGKHRVLAAGMLGSACVLPLMLLVEPEKTYQVTIIFALLGVVISPIWLLPTALVADAVDVGRLEGGGNQAGVYMSLYNLANKLALSLGVGIALPLVELLGFNPQAEDPYLTAGGLMSVGLILPALFFVPAVWILWHYPIDAKMHAAILNRVTNDVTN
jgi:GPH family glycoside/pentoside/hexuronide:cation symporter